MKRICKKTECCGCKACYNVCPKACITFVEDSEGFSYPEIKEENCINCGQCKKVCPILNCNNYLDEIQACYVAYADNEIRVKSSSGGIFSLLANVVLDNGGVVYGASFDEKWDVKHIGINRREELEKLRGSKYVQSDTGNTYFQVKEDLEKGRQVLYSGTACQITGLKMYLGKEYDNLFSIDVLCHGVPSPKVWRKYVKYLRIHNPNKCKISGISFRNKKNGWKDFGLKVEFKDGSNAFSSLNEDIYMRMFLENIDLRSSCYNCQFKKLERDSDISLGDCWGIDNYMPDMDDDRGTSVVLIHSQKGQDFFDEISDKIRCKLADVEKALPKNADSRKSVKPHLNRRKYMKKLKSDCDIEELYSCLDFSFTDKVMRKIHYYLGK